MFENYVLTELPRLAWAQEDEKPLEQGELWAYATRCSPGQLSIIQSKETICPRVSEMEPPSGLIMASFPHPLALSSDVVYLEKADFSTMSFITFS